MKYEIPKTTFMGKPVAGSLERVLAGLDKDPTPEPQTTNNQPITNLSGYVFVPSIGLYVAKQRTHPGLNWYQTHDELQKEGLRMLTIYEFKEFLKYLKQNPNGTSDSSSQEVESILDNILTVRNPWRSEWLDARFEKTKRKMNIHSMHKYSNENLTYLKTTEVLEDCLMKDKIPGINLDDWLNNSTKQGLPLENNISGNLYYWFPRDGCVAWFGAGSDRASLDCGWNPANTYSSLGVFACAEGAALKI